MKPIIDRKRHIAKAITWRIIATIATFTITYAITGSIELGASIGALDIIIKLLLYYLHERVWYKSKFGVKHSE